MTEEIEEILKGLHKIADSKCYADDVLYDENCQILLDYITSLQKENESLNNIINELDSWLSRLIKEFDENVSESIMHEQMVIRLVYDYLQILKGGEANDN